MKTCLDDGSTERRLATRRITSLVLLFSLVLCVGRSGRALQSKENHARGETSDAHTNPPVVIYDDARPVARSAFTSRTMVIVIEKRHRGYDDVYNALRSIAEQHAADKDLIIYAFSNRTDADKGIENITRMPLCRLTRTQLWGPDEEAPPAQPSREDSGRVATYGRAVGAEEEEVFFYWPEGQVRSDRVVIKRKPLPDYTGQPEADLVVAAFRADLEQLEAMIAAGVTPNAINAEGETALVTAVRRGNTAAVRGLLTHGADPNLATKRGATPLAAAILLLNEKMITLLVAHGADLNTHNHYDPPLLDLASAKATSKIVKQLLSAGAKVNATNSYGGTALMTACERLSMPIAKELLSAGADPNIALVRDGRTALMSCYFRTDMVLALIAAGANVNVHGEDGMTPLMLAAQWGFPEAVRVLIKAGAYVNARNNKGQSVLAVAIKDGDEDTERQLREAGALP